MRRLIYDNLLEWNNSADRKPLLLEGVRQCGKTYLLKEFGSREFGISRSIPDSLYTERDRYADTFSLCSITLTLIYPSLLDMYAGHPLMFAIRRWLCTLSQILCPLYLEDVFRIIPTENLICPFHTFNWKREAERIVSDCGNSFPHLRYTRVTVLILWMRDGN